MNLKISLNQIFLFKEGNVNFYKNVNCHEIKSSTDRLQQDLWIFVGILIEIFYFFGTEALKGLKDSLFEKL